MTICLPGNEILQLELFYFLLKLKKYREGNKKFFFNLHLYPFETKLIPALLMKKASNHKALWKIFYKFIIKITLNHLK
ncbi:hypothetical protein OK18_07740 [Chryseobacterium gallinarum]|uniref:Uncharacterized protein n=1 Tax=Chryseobacterium gallinarum TaxID=1324352 RepID=A0A0G3M105_CHRGL|nr:hypothetical protein OK18_07740 [Chryseobacterium gallinarum]